MQDPCYSTNLIPTPIQQKDLYGIIGPNQREFDFRGYNDTESLKYDPFSSNEFGQVYCSRREYSLFELSRATLSKTPARDFVEIRNGKSSDEMTIVYGSPRPQFAGVHSISLDVHLQNYIGISDDSN